MNVNKLLDQTVNVCMGLITYATRWARFQEHLT